MPKSLHFKIQKVAENLKLEKEEIESPTLRKKPENNHVSEK
tara:strand:+ start:295 stop:417 length:123 start_codon:yes stop_codon:yes gene_type:complete